VAMARTGNAKRAGKAQSRPANGKGGGLVKSKFNGPAQKGPSKKGPVIPAWPSKAQKAAPRVPQRAAGAKVPKWAMAPLPKVQQKGGPRPKMAAKGRDTRNGKKQVVAMKGTVAGKVTGKAAGKGLTPGEAKVKEKMSKIESKLKVWVGNLSEKTTWKALAKHLEDVAKPQLVNVMRKGTACVAYENEDDVATAIAAFNGSELDGKTIEVDDWTKPVREKKEKSADGEEKRQRKRGKKNKKAVVLTKFAKSSLISKKDKQRSDKLKEKLSGIDHTLKVWVGGLPDGTTWQKLSKFFEPVGKTVVTDIRKKGTACVAFETEDEVSRAILTMNGAEFLDKALQVDEWTKPERRELPKKEGKTD